MECCMEIKGGIGLKIFLAWFLTSLIGILFSYFETGGDAYFVLAFILVPIFSGIPNLIFLLILYYTRLFKETLDFLLFMIVEICLLYGIHYYVHKLIIAVPAEYRFETIAGSTSRKIYFNDWFQFIYTYTILFILILLGKGITKILKDRD
jgi:hypothetical protein